MAMNDEEVAGILGALNIISSAAVEKKQHKILINFPNKVSFTEVYTIRK